MYCWIMAKGKGVNPVSDKIPHHSTSEILEEALKARAELPDVTKVVYEPLRYNADGLCESKPIVQKTELIKTC